MRGYRSSVVGRLIRAGLSTRLVVGLVAVIFLTAAATALPAYSLIRTELERQARSRVEQGATSSLALLNAEQAQLDQLATLAAQRPTLRSILQEGNRQEVEAYQSLARRVSIALSKRSRSDEERKRRTRPSMSDSLPLARVLLTSTSLTPTVDWKSPSGSFRHGGSSSDPASIGRCPQPRVVPRLPAKADRRILPGQNRPRQPLSSLHLSTRPFET